MKFIYSTSSNKTSNKNFGFFFSFLFVGIFIYLYFKNSGLLYWKYFIISICFLFLAIYKPNSLTILNKCWFQLGNIMGKLTNPIILGVLFFFFITPISLILDLFRGDFLNIKNKKKKSYWRERKFNILSIDFFKHQF